MTVYYNAIYSGRAGGSFVPKGTSPITFVTWNAGADSGFIVSDIDLGGGAGKMAIAINDGSIPPDGADVLTQGAVTANVDRSSVLLYPAYQRGDTSVTRVGNDFDVRWTGPALAVTHSFYLDGQTVDVILGEILTWPNGAQCEVVNIVEQTGADGELQVRWLTFIDTVGFPVNNDAFTGDNGGDGVLNGEIHDRGYRAEAIHRFLSDLNDDQNISGDDDLSMIDYTATDRQTAVQVKLLGGVNIDLTYAQHCYGGSIEQGSGNTQSVFSGLGIQVTTPLGSTQPVAIKEDQIVADYWENARFPDSVVGNVRVMQQTVENGVAIDGQRIRGALLEFGELYFFAGTTIGFGEISLSLVSSGDGNNNTAVGTVAGAPYNTVIVTEGYQLLDYGEGSGATPFGLSFAFGSADSLQNYERSKYIQRRGTAELLFGRNAQLWVGINRNFSYAGETGIVAEGEVLAYGTEVPYTGETAGPFIKGDVVEDTVTLARGRVIYVDDQGVTGTLILADTVGSFGSTNAITTLRGAAETTATSGTVVNNSTSGQILVAAKDDQGATGDIWGQQLTGVVPVSGQTLFGATSLGTVDVSGTVEARTINSQIVGSYTGSNYNPANFGVAIAVANAIAGDLFTNLLENPIQPPDNRSGESTNLEIGDTVTHYPWDGVTNDVNGDPVPDFDEQQLTVALIAGVSTTVEVGAGNIPNNTPQPGELRIGRDADNDYDLVPYTSYNAVTGVYTLVGTAPSAAAISSNVFRAFIDVIHTSGSGVENFFAQFTNPPTPIAITVRRAGSPDPIKTAKTTANFGAYSVPTTRTPDA